MRSHSYTPKLPKNGCGKRYSPRSRSRVASTNSSVVLRASASRSKAGWRSATSAASKGMGVFLLIPRHVANASGRCKRRQKGTIFGGFCTPFDARSTIVCSTIVTCAITSAADHASSRGRRFQWLSGTTLAASIRSSRVQVRCARMGEMACISRSPISQSRRPSQRPQRFEARAAHRIGARKPAAPRADPLVSFHRVRKSLALPPESP